MPHTRTMAGVLIVGLLLIAPTGSARADAPEGLYVGLDAGLAWTANLTYYSTYGNCAVYPYYACGYNAYNAVTYNLGYAAGAQLGYAMGGPRVELEFTYRTNNANTIATASGTQSATGSLSAKALLVNLLYDFDTASEWVPYVGVGIGAADVSANQIHAASATGLSGYLDGSSTKFAAQFILGVEYQASQKFGVFIDWRGLWANGTTFNYGYGCPAGSTTGCAQTGNTSYGYWNGALDVGVHVRF